MKNKKKCIVLCILIGVFFLAFDIRLKTVHYNIETKKLSKPLTLAFLSDLHSCRYGKNQSNLLAAVRKGNPDVILLGGDVFDDGIDHKNAKLTLLLLAREYPCYYVSGNHEYWSHEMKELKIWLKENNITILEGTMETLFIKDEFLVIAGIDDPEINNYTKQIYGFENECAKIKKELEEKNISSLYTVFLSHRPELISLYKTLNADVILAGHAHGGQWRIPFFLNGIYAPNQGLFPKYAGGLYNLGNTTLIVSRGLSRESTKIPRIFNRPELVFIHLM